MRAQAATMPQSTPRWTRRKATSPNSRKPRAIIPRAVAATPERTASANGGFALEDPVEERAADGPRAQDDDEDCQDADDEHHAIRWVWIIVSRRVGNRKLNYGPVAPFLL